VSADDVSSEEWFARYLVDAGFLVALVLTAIGVSWYLDGSAYLRDWSREPGAGFLACMVLCPVLGIVTLGFAIYAGIRLFLRPYTVGHALVRLAFLLAHVLVFFVCVDTVATTAAALTGGFEQLLPGMGQSWSAIEGRDYPGSQDDLPEGAPDASPSSPPGFRPGPIGPSIPGRGTDLP
jgi:hypothetical protein